MVKYIARQSACAKRFHSAPRKAAGKRRLARGTGESQSSNLASCCHIPSLRVASECRHPLLPLRRLGARSNVPFLTFVKLIRPSAQDVPHRRRLRRLLAFLPHAPCPGACVAGNAAVVFSTFYNHMASCSTVGVAPSLPDTMRRFQTRERCVTTIP